MLIEVLGVIVEWVEPGKKPPQDIVYSLCKIIHAILVEDPPIIYQIHL